MQLVLQRIRRDLWAAGNDESGHGDGHLETRCERVQNTSLMTGNSERRAEKSRLD
jgi:hypothetical protein